MNSFIQAYRASQPNDTASDEELILYYGDQGNLSEMPPDFVTDYQKIKSQQTVAESGVGQEFTRGLSRGILGLETAGAGALALASDTLGAKGAKEFWLDVYKRKSQQAAEEAPASVPTIQQATASFPAAAQYVAGKVGELIPNVGEALGTAAIGTMAAPGPGTVASFWGKAAAKSALRRLAEKTLTAVERKELEEFAVGTLAGDALSANAAKAVTTASKYMAGVSASAANFAALGAGGAYGELAERPGVTPGAARTGALIAGAGASIGALIPASILRGVFGESIGEQAARSYVDKWAVKVPSKLMEAGGGMGAMEFFNILGEKYADPAKRDTDFTKDDWSRILNSVAVGVIAGTPAATIAAFRGVKPIKPGEKPPEPPAPPEPSVTTEEAPPPPPAPEAPQVEGPSRADQQIAESRRILQEARAKAFDELQRQKKQAERPVVPETPAEERESVVDEIRRNEARTIREIQQLFPKSELSREQARELRNAAWGKPDTYVAQAYGAVTKEQELVLREIAAKEVAGTLTDADREYVQQLNAGQKEYYKIIREEAEDATKERKGKSRVLAERERTDAELRKEREDRLQQAKLEEKGDEASVSYLLPEEEGGIGQAAAQAFNALPPEHKAAVASVIDPNEIGKPPVAAPGEAPPTKAPAAGEVSLAAPPEVAPSGAPPAIREATTKGEITQAPAISGGTEVRKAAAPVEAKPAPLGSKVMFGVDLYEKKAEGWVNGFGELAKYPELVEKNYRVLADLISRVPESVGAWREPFTSKVKEEFYTDIGRDPKDQKSTRRLGVFETPEGRIVVTTLYTSGGKQRTAIPGEKGPMTWDAAKEAGYKPVARIDTAERQKDFYREFNKDEWKPVEDQLKAKRDAATTKLGPEPEPFPKAAVPELREAAAEIPPKPQPFTPEDAQSIHAAVIEHVGGFPKADESKEMVQDTLLTKPELGRRLAVLSGQDYDVALDLIDRIAAVYEKAAASGEKDPAALTERITQELAGIRHETPELPKEAAATVPADVRTEEAVGALVTETPELLAKQRQQEIDGLKQLIKLGYREEFLKEKAKQIGVSDAELEQFKSDIRQSKPAEPSREPGRAELASVAQRVVQRLQESGIPVQVQQAKVGELLNSVGQSMGSYDRATKTVSAVLSDLSKPTPLDIRVLFEETAHALFDHEGPEVQEPILRAIASLDEANPALLDSVKRDIANAYPEGLRPEVYQEELAAGYLAKNLQAEGFNPIQSRSISQSIVQFLKDIYLKSALWFQRTFLGDEYNNSDLALRYFQNRLESFLTGDKEVPSWVDKLGGPKPSFDVEVGWHTPVSTSRDLAQTYNPVTTLVDTAHLLEDSVEAAMLNTRGDQMRYSIPAAGAPPPQWVDPAIQLNRDVAANNEVREAQQRASAAAGIDRAIFRKLNGLSDTDRIAQVKALAASERQAAGFKPDQRISDFTHEENVKTAAMEAIRRINREFGKIGKNLTWDKERLKDVEARLPGVLDKAEKELDRYTDAGFMGDEIEKGVRAMTVEDLRRAIQTSRALGTITQIYQQLSGEIDQPINPQFVNALRRLYTGTELQGQNLFDLLDFMANDPSIDFTRPATEIRQQIQHSAAMDPTLDPYQRMTQNTPESHALLSTVIAYGKTHQRVLADLEMRRMTSGQERVDLQEQLRDLWKETRAQITTGMKHLVRSAKLEERAKGAYRETLARAMAAKRAKEHLEQRIAANESAMPVYKEAIDKLDPRISRAVDAEFKDGMVLHLPKTLELRPQTWEDVTINLESTRGPITDLQPYAERLAAWTKLREEAANNGDETALNMDYQNARQQLLSIVNNRYYQQALQNSDRTITGLAVGPAAKQIESIGTPTAKAEAAMLNKAVSDTQVLRNQADISFGYRNPRLKMKVLGVLNQGSGWFRRKKVDVGWFNDYIKNAAFGFMEKMQGQEGVDRKADLDEGFRKLGTWLMGQPHIKPVIQERFNEFMPALRAWMESEFEAGQHWQKRATETGMLIEEPRLGEGFLRSAIPAGMLTFQRYFSPMFSNMVHALRLSGWATNGKDQLGPYGDFKTYRQLKETNPAAAQAMVDKYFNHQTYGDTVQKDFFHRLTHVPDESVFQSVPLDEMGTTIPLDPNMVSMAFDQAQGNVVRTFEILHQIQNATSNVNDYVQSGLMTLADQFHSMNSALNKVEPRSASEVSTFVNVVPNALIDARQFPHWPSEYFDYHEFDRNTNARMAERIAAQRNFGRDCRSLANLHEVLRKETGAFDALLQNTLRQAGRNVPSGEPKKIDAEAVKLLDKDKTPALAPFKTGKEKLDFLKKNEDRKQFVNDVLRNFAAYYQRGSDQNGSLRWGIRFAQAISGLLVNNPGSAISQLATMFDVPVQWGASPTMLKTTKRIVQLTGKDISGSLAQSIGMEFMKLSPYEQRLIDLKLNDAEVKRRFADIMAVQEGEVQNPWSRRFRLAKEAQSFTLNLRGEKAVYTPLRPLAPFFQSVMSANRALTVSLWELADGYVSKGVDYLKSHPGTKEITADMLGLKGLEKDSFERWRADAARYGFQFTESSKGALSRIEAGDKTMLTNEELGRLYSLGLNSISLEANMATMSLAAFNNNVVRFAVPLLGWSWRRALQVAEKGLDPNDQRSLKSVGTAMLGLAATGLGGLGLSLVVDAYQEDVIGKKRNIRALRFPTTGNDWLAIQERLNRIGTTGLWGELINSAVNVGTGQGDNRMLSVDQRVVALQSFQTLQRAIASFINQDFDPDYQHVVRPAIAALGGNGMLQYMQIANNAFDIDNVESRVVRRINAENYLRVAGRDLGMSIRTGGGSYNTPTPITPWIARMEYAAYANSPLEFREAYQGAVAEARAAGKPDPADYVKRAFETKHPLRYVFSATPSEREYREILANMDDRGQQSVTEAVRLFNYYGSHLGLSPFQGSAKKDQKRANPASAARARALALGF